MLKQDRVDACYQFTRHGYTSTQVYEKHKPTKDWYPNTVICAVRKSL